jgi:hypothetical protein
MNGKVLCCRRATVRVGRAAEPAGGRAALAQLARAHRFEIRAHAQTAIDAEATARAATGLAGRRRSSSPSSAAILAERAMVGTV